MQDKVTVVSALRDFFVIQRLLNISVIEQKTASCVPYSHTISYGKKYALYIICHV